MLHTPESVELVTLRRTPRFSCVQGTSAYAVSRESSFGNSRFAVETKSLRRTGSGQKRFGRLAQSSSPACKGRQSIKSVAVYSSNVKLTYLSCNLFGPIQHIPRIIQFQDCRERRVSFDHGSDRDFL